MSPSSRARALSARRKRRFRRKPSHEIDDLQRQPDLHVTSSADIVTNRVLPARWFSIALLAAGLARIFLSSVRAAPLTVAGRRH